MTWLSWHSKFTGDSSTRGGFIIADGAGVSPAISNSLVSAGYSAAVLFIASLMLSTTILITNSPVASILASVSFGLEGVLRAMDIATVGGFEDMALKNENGAKLKLPDSEIVDMKAIGRGITTPVSA